MSFEAGMMTVGGLLTLSIFASKFASRLGVPVLLFFLGVGMLAGSEGPGGLSFSDAKLAHDIGVVALAFILFGGGMDLPWKVSKPLLARSVLLATVGVVVTAGVVAFVAVSVLGYSLLEGLLLGSIVSSTDAAAVFSILTKGSLSVRTDLRRTLEIESGSNDPTAIFLTISLVGALTGERIDAWQTLLSFVVQMMVGGVGGWLVGRAGVLAMRRLRLEHEGLFHGLSIALVLVSFGGVTLLGGNGFLAVYVAGLTFGNGEFRQRKGLRRFHDGVAWLMQITLFVVLGLLVFPSQILHVLVPGLVVTASLMLVARPLGVFAALLPIRVPLKEQAFIAWAGLRGAVPMVLATYPLTEGIPRSADYFNIVFFVVILSALLQGTSLPYLSKALRLKEPEPPEPAIAAESGPAP